MIKMMISKLEKLRMRLHEYYDFEECIIEDVRWREYGSVIDLVFLYIWDEEHRVRKDIDSGPRIILRFSLVQEWHLYNALNSSMLENPECLNWGLSEVACVRIGEAREFTSAYKSSPRSFYHAVIHWEGERRIDIIFRDLEIIEDK